MSESEQTPSAKAGDPAADHDRLTEQIQHTRDELGAAVHELAAKADVKQRVADQAGRQAERIRDTASQQAERVRDAARQVARQASSTREQIVEPAGEIRDAVAADSRSRLVLAVASAALAVLAGILILRRRAGR